MNLVSRKWLVTLLMRLVLIVIVAKALSLGMLWFLPEEGVSFEKRESLQPAYARYNFGVAPPPSKPASTAATRPAPGLMLKGLYRTQKGGYVIVALKNNLSKSEVVGIGEAFDGIYTLVEITPLNAVFERGGVKETVWLEKPKYVEGAVISTPPDAEAEPGASAQTLSRGDVDRYAKNLDQVWKDIGIVEVKDGEKIEGFRVVRIRKGSPLSDIGLQKDDVIISINNKPLTSYAYAMELYQKIDTLTALQLVVRRNNQEKELVYEIR